MTKPKILRIWYAHRLDSQTQLGENGELQARFAAGQFHYLGIQAKAQVRLNGKRTLLASEGQWGIRSDHRLGIETAELVEGDQLRAALRQIGCGERAVIHAMAKAVRMGTNGERKI